MEGFAFQKKISVFQTWGLSRKHYNSGEAFTIHLLRNLEPSESNTHQSEQSISDVKCSKDCFYILVKLDRTRIMTSHKTLFFDSPPMQITPPHIIFPFSNLSIPPFHLDCELAEKQIRLKLQTVTLKRIDPLSVQSLQKKTQYFALSP